MGDMGTVQLGSSVGPPGVPGCEKNRILGTSNFSCHEGVLLPHQGQLPRAVPMCRVLQALPLTPATPLTLARTPDTTGLVSGSKCAPPSPCSVGAEGPREQ